MYERKRERGAGESVLLDFGYVKIATFVALYNVTPKGVNMHRMGAFQ